MESKQEQPAPKPKSWASDPDWTKRKVILHKPSPKPGKEKKNEER